VIPETVTKVGENAIYFNAVELEFYSSTHFGMQSLSSLKKLTIHGDVPQMLPFTIPENIENIYVDSEFYRDYITSELFANFIDKIKQFSAQYILGVRMA